MQDIIIRKIIESDNEALAVIIRNSLEEFKANKPGTVYFDDSTDHLFELFQQPGSIYFTAEKNNEILGGCGIYPTDNLPSQTCELVKFYLKPSDRGIGLGKHLLNICISNSKELGYKKMYLETMPELKTAIPLYEKCGFTYIGGPLGDSGHTGCDVWMIKEL